MLLNTSSASNPKLIRKRNKAEDELQLYYEVTISAFTQEIHLARRTTTHIIRFGFILFGMKNSSISVFLQHRVWIDRTYFTSFALTLTHSSWLLCPMLVGKTQLTQEKMVSISWSFMKRSNTGHDPNTQQSPAREWADPSLPHSPPHQFLKEL